MSVGGSCREGPECTIFYCRLVNGVVIFMKQWYIAVGLVGGALIFTFLGTVINAGRL